MEEIISQEFGGERPLYNKHDIHLTDVTIHVGESSVKECTDVKADKCRFEGKYVFWCDENVFVEDCYFAVTARSSVWHTSNFNMKDCLVDAPKMFRECDGVTLRNVKMPDASSAPGMLNARISTRVLEQGGDASIVSQSALFAPFSAFVGVKTGDGSFETDQDLKFPVIVVDKTGKAVTLSVSASGVANVGMMREGAMAADFAPVLTVGKVKKVLAIRTNLWFDRKNDHGSGVGEAKFVK